MSLQAGLEALKQGNHREAVQLLKEFCQYYTQEGSKDHIQAQIGLVRGYHRLGETEQAIAVCQTLATNKNSQVSSWATQALRTFTKTQTSQIPQTPQALATVAPTVNQPSPIQKAGRAAKVGVKLALAGKVGNLALASGVTIFLLFSMVLALSLGVVFLLDSDNLPFDFAIALGLTLVFNIAAFFLSPLLMDLTQNWLYHTRWVSLVEVERHSPEAAKVIQRVCQAKKLKTPRLGIINDKNPTAFTYGSLPNRARWWLVRDCLPIWMRRKLLPSTLTNSVTLSTGTLR
jgi:hypothetical protein